jgi:hypothetical protein
MDKHTRQLNKAPFIKPSIFKDHVDFRLWLEYYATIEQREDIVRAVNAHGELVAALKQALTDIEFYCERAEENPDTDTTAIELRRVLAKAEGSKNDR